MDDSKLKPNQFKEKVRTTEDYNRVVAAVRIEMKAELYLIGNFHAANVFFFYDFFKSWQGRHRLSGKQFQLLMFIYLKSKTTYNSGVDDLPHFHPSACPTLFNKKNDTQHTIRMCRYLRNCGLIQPFKLAGSLKKYYTITEDGKKRIHGFSRAYRSFITAWEAKNGNILFGDIARDFDFYK